MNKNEFREKLIELAKAYYNKQVIVNQLEQKMGCAISVTPREIDIAKYFHWDRKALEDEYKKIGKQYDDLNEYWDILWRIWK